MKPFFPKTRREFTFWALELQGLSQEEIDDYLDEAITCVARTSSNPLLYTEWIKLTIEKFPDIVQLNMHRTPFNTHVKITIAGVQVENLNLKSYFHRNLFSELENLHEVTVKR